MVAVTQKKAFKPGIYKGKLLSADDLRQYAEGTNAALKKGVPVPGLKKHAKLGADDKETDSFAATDGAGWLKGVEIDPKDGSLGWNLDVPAEIANGIKNNTIRFTSPEFRPNYSAADGRYVGPIIRHVAFTPLPKAHDQGPLAVAMSEEAFQFGEGDFDGPPPKKKKKPDGSDDDSGDDDAGDSSSNPTIDSDNAPPTKPDAEDPAQNPDMPANPTDKSKLDAIRACLSQLGAELASDWTWDNPGGPDQLLAVLKTVVKANQAAETEPDEPEEPDVKDSESSMPFSEAEIAALPPSVRKKAEAANTAALQFSEERAARKAEQAATARDKAKSAVAAAKLPPGLKSKLTGLLDAVQFSESGEAPTLTIQAAAAMFAESLPPALQFGEGDAAKDSGHPDGDQFHEGDPAKISDDEALAIARRAHSRDKSK